ncbi:hypothetical protein GmHk_19G054373 [Glycine max]|nr:hypothetical protein GmHk_19G054373 [Glycine max]
MSGNKHVPFPYKNSNAVPWRYAPPKPSKRKEETTDIDSLSAKVTNITCLSGVTHSGHVFAPPDLPARPVNAKGKAKVIKEQTNKASPVSDEDVSIGRFTKRKEVHDYEPGMGLGKNNDGMAGVVDIKGNHERFRLGYKPTQADVRKNILERRNKGQGSQPRPQAREVPPCHISRSFVSMGLRHEEQVTAIFDEAPQRRLGLVQPCLPDFQLGNWQVVERLEVYMTNIM